MASNTTSKKTEIKDTLDFIAGFESGEFSKKLNKTDDPILQQIVDKLNSAAKYLADNSIKSNKEHDRINAHFIQSSDAIMTLAPPTWKFTGCNPAALKLFKIPNQIEFLKLGPWNLSPERQSDGSLSSNKAIEAIKIAMKQVAISLIGII